MLAAWGLALAEASQLVAGTSISVAPPLGVLVGLWTLVALGSLFHYVMKGPNEVSKEVEAEVERELEGEK